MTASHKPIDYNGMKLVKEGSRPISGETGLFEIQSVAELADWFPCTASDRGSIPRFQY